MNLRSVVPGILFAISLGILAIGWTVVCIGRGEYLTAVATLAFAIGLLAMVVPSMRSLSGRIRPRGTSDDEGTTFRPDLVFDIAVWVAGASLISACALSAIFIPLGKLDIPVPHSGRYAIPFMAGVVVLTGVPAMWLTVRRGSTKYLRLTPAGYDMAESYKPERGGWDEIADITGVVPESYRQVPNPLVLVKRDGTAAVFGAGSTTPGGSELRELVRFYWQHPESRGELTNGRALERLSDGRFEPES